MAGWLYRYEAKSIQEFVLGTSRLREIEGASGLVEELAGRARKWAGELEGVEVIVGAAGGATMVFRDLGALRRFASAWPLACSRWCPGLQVIQGWAEFEGVEPDGATLRNLHEALHADRMRPAVYLPEVGPAAQRAGRTGEAAVENRPAQEGRDGGFFGRGSVAKDNAADNQTLDQRFDPSVGRARRFTSNLERFGEGYLAVIHADGNRVGTLLQQRVVPQGAEAWKRFSKALGEATEEAARRAYRAIAGGWIDERELPFRPVVLGGDDLTVITRAEDAPTFTVEFLKAFEVETAARRDELAGDERLTACAGVALVKPGFPFHAASQLAESLCREAKARRSEGAPSSFAFHRVTTASVRAWDEIRRDELAGGGLFGGPWFVSDYDHRGYDALCSLARYVGDREVPKGSLREWLTLAQVDREKAKTHWRRMLEVLSRSSAGVQIGKDFERTLSTLGANADGWRGDDTTPVGDALTLLAVQDKALLQKEATT